MKEYYYMFSHGSYSDYCVGGLYKSKMELGEQFFAETLRQMLIEQVGDWSEAVEMFKEKEWNEVLISFGSAEWVKIKLFELVNGKDVYAYGTAERDLYRAARNEYSKKTEVDTDFVAKLVKDGVLEALEYKEIWHDS